MGEGSKIVVTGDVTQIDLPNKEVSDKGSIVTDVELDIVKRGRNASTYSHPKNTDIVTYKWATAFECLFGYLYLLNKNERIDEIMKIILEENI